LSADGTAKIAGWDIKPAVLEKKYTTVVEGKQIDRWTLMAADGIDNNAAFGVYHKSSTATEYTPDFYVTNNGKFYANKATIVGDITAESGTL
jgi:hypothetical protein